MDLIRSMKISATGMRAQGTRLRVVSENIANATTTAQVPGGSPYRRKTIFFENELNRQINADTVRVKKVSVDRSPFKMKYEPFHPAANADGYVAYPNVNSIIEMSDMREAQRSYEANLSVLDTSKNMIMATLDILRG